MANTLKIKRGTAATIPQGQLAEPLFTTDTYDLYIGKGSGGNQRIQNYIASGTSSQFLKGDGSLDSTSYQTALTFSSPLVNTSGTISIPAATGSVNGYLTSTDWTTFNSKEPAITAGTSLQYYRGDKTFQTLNTSVVPESGAVYFTEPRVLATVLTGLNLSGGGTIAATDSILTAFGKVQNQISALVGGATYQGVWNASTNSPSLASGVGTKGFYYVVSVAGSTNLDGITDWKVGDWAIFNGTTWDKVDNTDAVSSVNGFTGAVNLGLGDISNVTLSSPTNAQLLRFNGTSSKWENWTPTYISGNQTITLSGDVSGSGTTAITTTIGALKVTNAMLAGTIDYAKMDATTVPTWNQNTTGSAATLTTARNFTINGTAKSFDGSANVSWTAAEIGLTSYLPLSGGTLTGALSGTSATFSGAVQVTNGDSKFYSAGTSLWWGGSGTDYGQLNWNTGEAIIAATTGNQLTFRTGGITSAQNRLIISSTGAATFSGFIGINGAAATYPLTVNGSNSTAANNTITGATADLYALAIRQKGANAGIGGSNFMAQIISAAGAEGLEIYTPNSKELILGTNATARLTISSTGAATFSSSVTAKTQNNYDQFHAGAFEAVSATDNSKYLQIGYNATSNFGWIQPLEQGVAYRNLILNGAGGNVGIGTTSPSYILDVVGGAGNPVALSLSNANSNCDIIMTSGGGGSAVRIRNNINDLQFHTNGSERMRVTSGGNVGIGTTSPTTFSGNTTLAINNSAGGAVLELQSNGTSALRMACSSSDAALWEPRNTPVLFATNNTERMRIKSDGEVLIGTTTDAGAYILQANGSVYATSYFESSDIRLKDVITNSYSENFSAIEFMWKDKRDVKKHWGYAAQDVMKYIPDAIEVNNDGMMTVNYNEAHTWKIAQLEAKILELEAKLK